MTIHTVYIAGPYTKPDPVLNVRAHCMAAEQVRKMGLLPFVPLLSHLWHLVSPHDYDYWMEMDLEWVAQCDAVLRLPGESAGADSEVRMAKEMGKPVFYSVDELREAR